MKLQNLISIIFAILLCSCHDKVENMNHQLTLGSYAAFSYDSLTLNSHRIREQLDRMIRNDVDSTTADYRTRSYYMNDGAFLWIDRHGVDCRADSLLKFLHTLSGEGFSPEKFRVHQIEKDLSRIRNLDIPQGVSINRIMGRLEYNLTKAYLRYSSGQRFGYMNPTYVFNRLDPMDPNAVKDSSPVRYRTLYDVHMEHAGKDFWPMAIRKIYNDSVSIFLHEIQPTSPMYKQLGRLLQSTADPEKRVRILCNMERLRWRLKDYPQRYKKYVLLNIPSYRLRAVDGDKELTMRVGCGTQNTKTPLLSSWIKRMDVNPQWIMPRSIIEKSVVHHVGNRRWFESQNYYVRYRKTGKTIPIEQVTYNMLKDKDFLVIQKGGKGNSLGRIIFRFDNGFSIFLHDTSNRDFFAKDSRDVSHGCVRVQKPFDLALFLLKDKDENTIHKLRYSMEVDSINSDTVKKKWLLSSLPVEPQIPLFITYFTIYPDINGNLVFYPDVYGYDDVIYRYLKNYR